MGLRFHFSYKITLYFQVTVVWEGRTIPGCPMRVGFDIFAFFDLA